MAGLLKKQAPLVANATPWSAAGSQLPSPNNTVVALALSLDRQKIDLVTNGPYFRPAVEQNSEYSLEN